MSIRAMVPAKIVIRGWLVCVIALGLLEPRVFGGKPLRGHVCVTEEGGRGRCVPVKQCDSILSTLRKQVHTNADSWYVYGNECGRAPDGKSLVCCVQGSSHPGANETNVRLNVESTSQKIPDTTLPVSPVSEPVCGLQPSAREIYVHGTSQTIGFHPWTVLLHNGNRPYDTKFPCTGTLISVQYVLTSAGCVDDAEKRANLTARLGEYDLEATVDCLFLDGDVDAFCAESSYDVNVTEVVIHENGGDIRNDIALLKLSNTVELNEWVFPICLSETHAVEESYHAASWNQNTCDETRRRHKLVSSYNIANRTACGRHLPNGTWHEFVCVSTAGQPFVDLGGALTVTKTIIANDQRSRSVHELVGILSSMLSCANYDGVLAYTKVGPHLEWIRSKMVHPNDKAGTVDTAF
uniref:CLIP domain-containing serine protease n=1 Tax=Anopheles atroparvus TaxID=41427 RepID=A0A182JAC2_ANOAO